MTSRARRCQPADAPAGPKATRTREILIGAARDLFITHGYVDTGVDDIAESAQVSRPTFYTYFGSKRDVFEAIGRTASDAATPVFDRLGELGPAWTTADVTAWVRSCFAYYQMYGSWALVWRQATTFDRHLREASQSARRYNALKIGQHLHALGNSSESDPLYDGLIVLAMLETLWAEGLQSRGSEPLLVDAAAKAIEALIRQA